MLSLYQELIQAGVKCHNRESDLFFPATELTHNILEKHKIAKLNAEKFISKDTGECTYMCPFEYSPYWGKIL